MILTTILGLGLLGQTALPGDSVTIEQAREKADVIVVARFDGGLIFGLGASSFGVIDLKVSSVRKGRVDGGRIEKASLSFSGAEVCPKTEEDYLFFLQVKDRHWTILKVAPRTPEVLAAAGGRAGDGH